MSDKVLYTIGDARSIQGDVGILMVRADMSKDGRCDAAEVRVLYEKFQDFFEHLHTLGASCLDGPPELQLEIVMRMDKARSDLFGFAEVIARQIEADSLALLTTRDAEQMIAAVKEASSCLRDEDSGAEMDSTAMMIRHALSSNHIDSSSLLGVLTVAQLDLVSLSDMTESAIETAAHNLELS